MVLFSSLPASHAPIGNGGTIVVVTHWQRHSVLNTSAGSSACAAMSVESSIVYPKEGFACASACTSLGSASGSADHSNHPSALDSAEASASGSDSPIAFTIPSGSPSCACALSRKWRSTTLVPSPALDMHHIREFFRAIPVLESAAHASHVWCSRSSSRRTRSADLPRPAFLFDALTR